MNKKEADRLKLSIKNCEMKLQKLMPYLGENKPALNKEFNRILIEKAVLRDKLKRKKVSIFAKLAEKIIRKPEQKLICDYFK